METKEAGSEAPRSRRGFAAMSAERQREIASKGGRAAHEKGTAHEFSANEAREAGRKGGQAVSRDREHMSRIGREGGRKAHSKRSKVPDEPAH
jgi:general stress protein YciG